MLGRQFTRLTGWFAAGDHPPGLSDQAREDLFEQVLRIIARATPPPAKTPRERLIKAVMLKWLVRAAAEPDPVHDLVLSLCRDWGVQQ